MGPGTLGLPASVENAQTCGSSIGPPIVSSGWTAWRHGRAPRVTSPPCSSTWTTSGGDVYGSFPSSPLTFAGGSPRFGLLELPPIAVQPASTAVPTPPLAAGNSRREIPVPGAPIRSVMIQLIVQEVGEQTANPILSDWEPALHERETHMCFRSSRVLTDAATPTEARSSVGSPERRPGSPPIDDGANVVLGPLTDGRIDQEPKERTTKRLRPTPDRRAASFGGDRAGRAPGGRRGRSRLQARRRRERPRRNRRCRRSRRRRRCPRGSRDCRRR